MTNGLYWLASYPKSGNTWLRLFIANLSGEDLEQEEAVDINDLQTGAIASSRVWVEKTLGFDIGEFSHDEMDLLRSDVYIWNAEHADKVEYHKVHDAYSMLSNGRFLFPAEATRGTLYLLRNPLDVAISYAHHSNTTIDKAIKSMGNSDFTVCGGEKCLYKQLRQRMLSWSGHVLSWADAELLNRLVIRYEDMINQPISTFTKIATFLELPTDESLITQAVENCAIDKLQHQEKQKGFKERMGKSKRFFRKGKAGDWKTILTSHQIDRIVSDHYDVMKRFGYLDSQGNPLVTPLPIQQGNQKVAPLQLTENLQ